MQLGLFKIHLIIAHKLYHAGHFALTVVAESQSGTDTGNTNRRKVYHLNNKERKFCHLFAICIHCTASIACSSILAWKRL